MKKIASMWKKFRFEQNNDFPFAVLIQFFAEKKRLFFGANEIIFFGWKRLPIIGSFSNSYFFSKYVDYSRTQSSSWKIYVCQRMIHYAKK